jgi:aryl-alcohol dehydrogenase-like predicted oxidoreductase
MRLGNTDLIVSRLGIGAMVWGDLSISPRFSPARIAYGPAFDKEELRKTIDSSIGNGVTFLDTAAFYGKGASELMVGELTQGKEIIIATKFPSNMIPRTGNLPRDLENSLKRLKRESVDLYQIHYPSPFISIPKVLDLMADAYQEGKIKAIGVSNFSEKQMRLAFDVLTNGDCRLLRTR